MNKPFPFRSMLALLVALITLLAFRSVLLAAEDDVPPPAETAGVDLRDPAVIASGMEMLNSTCGGYCHGTQGRGYEGPSLRNRNDLTADVLYQTIFFGRKRGGKLMPPWGEALSEEEIWTAVAAIVSLRQAPKD